MFATTLNLSEHEHRSVRVMKPSPTALPFRAARLQRKSQCACGGGCPRCIERGESLMARKAADEASPGSTEQPQAGYVPEEITICLDRNVPPRCHFTSRQERLLSVVRYDARSVTSRALLAVSSGDPYMATLARRIFQVSDVDMQAVADTVASILDKLRTLPLACGSCGDDGCNEAGVVAYTEDDLSGIVICQPRFFANNLVQQRRTLIHEAGHGAGIDQGRVKQGRAESYCREDSSVECADPCGNISGDLRQNVDAWARFIECAAFSY